MGIETVVEGLAKSFGRQVVWQDDGLTVLRTQNDQASAIRSFAQSAAR